MKGNFIVIYGANNLGKSTQLNLLEKRLVSLNIRYIRLKYPIYTSETGQLINKILRTPDRLTEEEQNLYAQKTPECEANLQKLFADNRRDYQVELLSYLNNGITVIAEDYVGTGMAWGLVRNVPRDKLNEFNEGLLIPDKAILLDGERFIQPGSIEQGHRNESDNQQSWETSRRIHLELAKEFGWKIVNANNPPEKVANEIWEKIGRRQ